MAFIPIDLKQNFTFNLCGNITWMNSSFLLFFRRATFLECAGYLSFLTLKAIISCNLIEVVAK